MMLKISRILHAGYVFEYNETQIAFDPIFENPFSRNCYAFPDVQFDFNQIKKLRFAAVFISHFHDDHCSLESLHLLDRSTPIYLYCLYEELFSLIKELGFDHVFHLKIDQSVQIGSLEVIPRQALDADVDSLFHIKAGALNVLNVVDSWIDLKTMQQLADYGPWDLVLWPFQVMRETEVLTPTRIIAEPSEVPIEWIEQLQILRPRFIVASSCQFIHENWSWYNQALFSISYCQFEQALQKHVPNSKVIRLNPSVSVVLDQETLEISDSLSWVQPIGDQNVDYQYDPQLKAPSMQEVSRHFAPLSTEQMQKILEYCNLRLLDKYRSMDPPLEIYFNKPRLWRLSLYDHLGKAIVFYYIIKGSTIERATGNEALLAWTTELPISKILAALEDGESLTSMYVRINDVTFEQDIESKIAFVDILEDPLLRSLFNGSIGSYQQAQLKRIKGKIDK